MTTCKRTVAFNSKLADFIDKLIDLNPSIKDFELMKEACAWATNIDYKIPMQMFKTCIDDNYAEKIKACDDNFFLSEAYTHMSPELEDKYKIDMDLITTLKKIWRTLNDKEKKVIWNYLNLLVILSSDAKPLH